MLTVIAVRAQPARFSAKFDLSMHTLYSEAAGYGFEPGDTPGAFYFSMRVPEEGNYKVTVTLGDPAAESVTTVKAELRRLMLERVRVAAGAAETRSFLVNIRMPVISTGGDVRLKDREKAGEAWAWDNRITLEFSGAHAAVRRVEVEKVGSVPTIFIAGDSTSTDQPVEPYNSWGQMLTRFFQPTIAIANHGESGESLSSFLGEHRLDKVLSVIRPGDYLLIQMGHNDQKEKGEGVGAFTTYKADLEHFVAAAREHGATPVLIASMNRLTFDSAGKIVNSLGDYPEAVRRVAREQKVALIDLHAMSKLFTKRSAIATRIWRSPAATPPTIATTAAMSWRGAWWRESGRRNCRWRNILWKRRRTTPRIPTRRRSSHCRWTRCPPGSKDRDIGKNRPWQPLPQGHGSVA